MGERLKQYLKQMEALVTAAEQEVAQQQMHCGTKETRNVRTDAETTEIPEMGTPVVTEFCTRMEHEKAELLVQIGFFQHERLVHLIVTVLFALMTILVFLYTMLEFSVWAGVLLLLLLALLIPYIKHYYLLENGTQKLYQYYDKLEVLSNGKE